MSATINFRAYEPSDLEAVLRMNHESVHFLAPMDADRLQLMQSWGARVRIAEYHGRVAGFLITFEDGSDYDSVNYRWFFEHLKRFEYIDRIVIDQSCRGKGIGQQIYRLLKIGGSERSSDQYSRSDVQTHERRLWLAAEIDIEPRNDYSLSFHQQQGFVEVARQSAGQGKLVSLQVLSL